MTEDAARTASAGYNLLELFSTLWSYDETKLVLAILGLMLLMYLAWRFVIRDGVYFVTEYSAKQIAAFFEGKRMQEGDRRRQQGIAAQTIATGLEGDVDNGLLTREFVDDLYKRMAHGLPPIKRAIEPEPKPIKEVLAPKWAAASFVDGMMKKLHLRKEKEEHPRDQLAQCFKTNN